MLSKLVKLISLIWIQNHFLQFFRVSSCMYIPKILKFWKPKEISRKKYEMVLNYSTTAHFLFLILQKLLLNWFFIVASCKLIDFWRLLQIFTSKCWLLIKKCNVATLMFLSNLFLTSFGTCDSVVSNYRWWKEASPSEYSNEFANS